ncbi:SPOR domain-containing protein [Massilia putida]|uniref:SPOR domain-containing protein n=1 Tax=Massilia putida TaxID=1141883 RepID=UPI000952F061|nr:SPOR domain-containing protein [Massilia putida]
MLRLAFWSLLFLNAALFAYAQGLLGTGKSNEHEPARLKRQFNTAKMTLLTRDQAEAAAKAATPPAGGDEAAVPAAGAAAAGAPAASVPAAGAPAGGAASPSAAASAPASVAAPAPAPANNTGAAAAAPAPAPAFACTEIGPFDAGDARRFEARLATLDLGDRQSRQSVQAQDVTSWLVHIPPQGSKEAADKKAAELRNLGLTNFYIMQGDSPLKYGISLGVFKTESGAQAMLAQLVKQGVHTARIAPRGPQTTHYVYRVRNLDAATRKRIAGFAERYDGAEVKACG